MQNLIAWYVCNFDPLSLKELAGVGENVNLCLGECNPPCHAITDVNRACAVIPVRASRDYTYPFVFIERALLAPNTEHASSFSAHSVRLDPL